VEVLDMIINVDGNVDGNTQGPVDVNGNGSIENIDSRSCCITTDRRIIEIIMATRLILLV
jgi:hypothetical protein